MGIYLSEALITIQTVIIGLQLHQDHGQKQEADETEESEQEEG